MHGRVRRSDPDDPEKIAIVHDHGNNWSRYAHPDIYEAEFNELCKNEKKESDDKQKESSVKMKECPKCGYYVKGKFCLFCGHELKKYSEFIDGEVVEFEDGKMVEVIKKKTKTKEKKEKKFTKQDFYSMLLTQASIKNYKKGWVSHKYRDYFGVWPRGLSDGLKTRTPEFTSYLQYLNIKRAKQNAKNNN
jgi:Zn ribbon nucleic-acid-binding protein